MRTPPPVLPPASEQPEYETTWFDRRGPDAGNELRVRGASAMIGVGSIVIWSLIGDRLLHLQAWKELAFTTAGCIGSGFAAYRMIAFLAGGAGAVARAVTFPVGASTPYDEQYSYQESLAARGDIAGALESHEALIAERPAAVTPRTRAAEHYARDGRDPARAAKLFLQVRAVPEVSSRDAQYASIRLVDLYDGPLADPGRARVELRRIIELYPNSPLARHARTALPRLKQRLAAEQG